MSSSPTKGALHQETFSSQNSDATTVDESGLKTSGLQPVASRNSTLQPLPKGAMAAPVGSVPTAPYKTQSVFVPSRRLDSPPATASQRLLDPDPSHVQFASYSDEDEKTKHLMKASEEEPHWIPPPLRTWYWVSLVVFLVALGIALEVALHFSHVKQGWATNGDISNTTGVLHYVYTLPPVIVAGIIVALWAWTDVEIKKLQPYVDLVHGDSPPHKSLLLDYTRTNNFVVWTRAAVNRHYLVALASLMVLLALTFQPLSAALLAVRNTWIALPPTTVNTLAAIGLNQNSNFNDLTSFLTSAGYAGASVLFDLPNPPFIQGVYTVAPFQVLKDQASNGTVFANTTAIKSNTGCQSAPVTMTNHTDGSGWTNSATLNGCSITWDVDHSAITLFGTDTPTCASTVPEQFSPVVFWFFTYQPNAKSSATFCNPSISLWDVNVNVDIASGNLTKVTELRPFTSSSNFSSLSANVTGAPLNGRAYNGIKFNLTNPDEFVLARQNATQLQMPAAVFQAAVQSTQGVQASFDADLFVQWSNDVYAVYLTLVAKEVYFLPHQEPITVQVKSFKLRVYLSDVAVHLLSVGLFLLAFFATIIHIFHRYDRRDLRLLHQPGTIASAVAIGAQTSMGDLLAGRQNSRDISEVLHNKKFRIDPHSMKIVMEGDDGYEFASSPAARRGSVFAALQNANRNSRRFSTRSTRPGSPTTPKPVAV